MPFQYPSIRTLLLKARKLATAGAPESSNLRVSSAASTETRARVSFAKGQSVVYERSSTVDDGRGMVLGEVVGVHHDGPTSFDDEPNGTQIGGHILHPHSRVQHTNYHRCKISHRSFRIHIPRVVSGSYRRAAPVANPAAYYTIRLETGHEVQCEAQRLRAAPPTIVREESGAVGGSSEVAVRRLARMQCAGNTDAMTLRIDAGDDVDIDLQVQMELAKAGFADDVWKDKGFAVKFSMAGVGGADDQPVAEKDAPPTDTAGSTTHQPPTLAANVRATVATGVAGSESASAHHHAGNALKSETRMDGLERLRQLYLFRERGTKPPLLPMALPTELWTFRLLTCLSLSGLGLTTLPAGLAQLTRLRILAVSDCALRSFPRILGSLTGLRDLRLDRNRLESTPELRCDGMTGLRFLDLSRNRLVRCPRGVAHLSDSLQTLLLDGNRLKRLPPEVARLRVLTILSLQRNPLAKRDQTFVDLCARLNGELAAASTRAADEAAVAAKGPGAGIAVIQRELRRRQRVLVDAAQGGRSGGVDDRGNLLPAKARAKSIGAVGGRSRRVDDLALRYPPPLDLPLEGPSNGEDRGVDLASAMTLRDGLYEGLWNERRIAAPSDTRGANLNSSAQFAAARDFSALRIDAARLSGRLDLRGCATVVPELFELKDVSEVACDIQQLGVELRWEGDRPFTVPRSSGSGSSSGGIGSISSAPQGQSAPAAGSGARREVHLTPVLQLLFSLPKLCVLYLHAPVSLRSSAGPGGHAALYENVEGGGEEGRRRREPPFIGGYTDRDPPVILPRVHGALQLAFHIVNASLVSGGRAVKYILMTRNNSYM